MKPFTFADAQNYPIKLITKSPTNKGIISMEIFPLFTPIPAKKLIVFNRHEPFAIEAHYDSLYIAKEYSFIGRLVINDFKSTDSDEYSKVQVQVEVNLHGIFNIIGSNLNGNIENNKVPKTSNEVIFCCEGDKEIKLNDNTASPSELPEQLAHISKIIKESSLYLQDMNNETSIEKNKKRKNEMIKLNFVYNCPDICKIDINKYMELENEMIEQDYQETKRKETKNTLSEYVYEMRINIYANFSKYFQSDENDKLIKRLIDVEQWLYNEGEVETKEVYLEKYNFLKKIFDPAVMRYNEASKKPAAFEALSHSLQMISKSLQAYIDKDVNSHLNAADIEIVKDCIVEKQSWYDKHVQFQINNLDPSTITLLMIKSQYDLLNSTCNPIINKLKLMSKDETPKGKMPKKNQSQIV